MGNIQIHSFLNTTLRLVGTWDLGPFAAVLAAAAAKSLQSCPTLCDPIDGSPPGSPIPGILGIIWIKFSK